MIVVVKSGPDTADGRRGAAIARSEGGDIVLLQDAVAFAQQRQAASLGAGRTYALEDDLRLRGFGEADLDARVLRVGYAELVDLLAAGDKVVGAF